MAQNKQQEEVVRCWCFSKNGEPHCPLTTDEQDLKRYFNYFTEDIVWVDIDKNFVCHEKRDEHCKNCPFCNKAYIAKASGEVIETIPKNGTDFQLDELQAIVGGYIEIVNLRDGRIICLNDESKINGMPYNSIATDIYRGAFPTSDFICGDVLVCMDGQIK